MDAEAVLRGWHDRTGEYSPDYYAYYGPDDRSEHLRAHLDEWCGPAASVLEPGCSAGRHLAHLEEHGYSNLSGIDINDDALAVLHQAYPELARVGTFYFDAIEAVIRDFDDAAFDAVFTVETLQHIHPDSAWVFAEIARITGELLITVEIEGGERPAGDVSYVTDGVPIFYRDWAAVFTDLGFDEVDTSSLGSDTLRVFRATTA